MWHLSYHQAGAAGEDHEAALSVQFGLPVRPSVRLPVSLSARPSAAWRGVFFAFQLLPHFFCVRFWNPWNISRHDLVAFHAHRTQRATQGRHARGGGGRSEGEDMYNENARYLRVRSWHIFIWSASNGGRGSSSCPRLRRCPLPCAPFPQR